MLKRFMLLMSVTLLLTACATNRVTDFTNRSLGYGWLNIKDVDANRLHAVDIYQFSPKTEEPYYPTTVKEFKGGYLYYAMTLVNGSHKTINAAGQRCLGILCSNTIYQYSFGKQGDKVGAVTIKSPGVYHMGSYKLKDINTGFFEQGKFEVVPADDAPSKRELLEEILKDAQDVPVMAERIKRELAQTR
jgi:hypothetical protein